MKTLATFLLLVVTGVVSTLGAGRQLTGQHAPAATPALSPADAQTKFVVPDGFEVRLFAAEPDVINPVAMTWDERGRLWVVELYEYPLGAPAGQKGRDCIKILEDTDNDGRADKVTVFADGLNLATGILIGNGGVYVGQAPDLLFLQDTNHDDVADTRTVLLTGFGLEDRHELLNGFTWGPDGWLYMTHGIFTHSKVRIPEASEPGVEVTAAVARFHPRTKKFEVFAEGTSNPWGVDFDAAGNAFVSACVIDHLFHMAPGGTYQRQAGTPSNPYTYEILPSIVNHKHHMAAYCGICIYQGAQFPAEYRGRVFMGNIHQNAINHDRLIPNGSSFKAVAEKDFLTTSDGWFRPISEQVGPDGALWIGDWCDKYPCYQNARADPEGVDRERGRISLTDLGMAADTLAQFTEVISRPHGIVLATGPTGSGKTTTLYAAVELIRTGREKILTVEDPVEYELSGVPQVPVNEKVGVTFAGALRALLRQDPDVILVGEIRDGETAQIATQAALTGHLVLSTLHTNDAPTALTRLLDLQVAAYLVASTVDAVLAQRLLRRICPSCRAPAPADARLAKLVDLDRHDLHTRWRGAGCDACRGTGYLGRVGIYELLVMDNALRVEVQQRRGSEELRAMAIAGGMRTLQEDGFRLVRDGVTTLEEVVRVARA